MEVREISAYSTQIDSAQTAYKLTEVGPIPEDWDIMTLGGCLDLLTDFEANGSFADVAENVRVVDHEDFSWYVRATDLENNSLLSDVRYVDERSHYFLKKTALHGGEVLITKRGEIGKVYFFKLRSPYATLAPNLYLLKLNSKALPKFVYFYFRHGRGNTALKAINASTTLGALYKNDVKALLVPLPPTKVEQEAIAEALSDADALIESLEQLIAKKRQIKQGTMQALLTGKQRLSGFSGEWKEITLGDLGSTYGGLTGKMKSDFGDGAGRYVTFMNVMSNVVIDCEAFDRVKILPAESQNRVISGDLLFNGSSETPEEVALCALVTKGIPNLFLNSFCFGFRFRDSASADGLFMAYFLRGLEGRELMKSLAQGSTRYNLSKAALLKAPLRLPGISEQTAIATILTDMDTELAELETRLAKTRQLKQGMMQELLTGRIRLTPRPAEADR